MSRATAMMPPVSIGEAKAPQEARADQAAARASDRMGLGYGPGVSPATDRFGGKVAPQAALRAAQGTGHPLPQPLRGRMEQGFGRDFSQVRIHDDAQAAQGARSVGADAFALGAHIVFGAGRWQPGSRQGAALLTHELAHVASGGDDRTLRRGVGFFQKIARFFGGGTFELPELQDYLYRLSGKNPSGLPGADTGSIEGNMDSDNKARAVVRNGLHKDQPIRVRHLLIEEMLDGVVTEPDEEAIIQILQDALPPDLIEIVELVGSQRLQDKLDGKEYRDFMALLGTIRATDPLPAVPLDWKINSTISGAPNAMPGKQGIWIEALEFQTMDGTSTSVASDVSVTQPLQEVASNIGHPRNAPGEVFINALPGRIKGEKVIPQALGMQQARTGYPIISHEFDTVEVLLDLVYSERQARVDKTGHTRETGTTKGTDQAHTEGKSVSNTTGTNRTTGQHDSTSGTVGVTKGATQGGSVTVKKGAAVRQGAADTDVDLKTTKDEKTTVDEKTQVDTKDSYDLTGKTTGTNTTTGDMTIDLSDITFDADVNTAIKGSAEVTKGSDSWTRKLHELTKPIQRKIIEKVVKRYLGPGSGPAADGIQWIIDKLVGDPPDWTVSVDLKNKGKVKGSLSGEITAKWTEVQKINTKTETTGDVTTSGTQTTTGTNTTKGSGTVKGTQKTDSVEVEQSAGVEQSASGSRSVDVSKSASKGQTRIDETTKVDETTVGTSSSDTTTQIDRRHDSDSEFTGTDRNVFEAFFERADLRVRLTGEKGRYHQQSQPGQRGGGGSQRPVQQKGAEK